MRYVPVLIAIASMVCACSQDSTLPIEKDNPDPTCQDAVTVPEDATPWTSDKCQMDQDCADMEGLKPCQSGKCTQGKCVAQDRVPGSDCESGDVTGECRRGVCEKTDAGIACVSRPAVDGTPCGASYPACGTSGKCKDGACLDACDDGDVCTDDTCKETGCVHEFNTAPCDDMNSCTANDACKDGACEGTKVCDCKQDSDCEHLDDGNPCNGTMWCKKSQSGANTCELKKTTIKCQVTGFEPCQANVCQPSTGLCKFNIADDGTACDDGVKCTDGDFCQEGKCTGFAEVTCELVCDDGIDDDGDSLLDCDDPDCFGIGDCPTPECGDLECQEIVDETCGNCPEDCGECPPECGDDTLQVESGEECDDGNLVPGDLCDASCKVEPAPALAGDIIVTEIMKNPDKVGDAEGEWFEVYNTTDKDIDINAWQIKDLATDKHRIFVLGGLVVPAEGYLVLGANADPLTNGGADVDYGYTGINLGNSGDEIMLFSGETLVDEVVYDKGPNFIDPKGASLSLSPDAMTAEGNDLGSNWCAGQDAYGLGDLGSPGTANPACPKCGDSVCNGNENCTTCADCDCGDGGMCVDGNCVEKKTPGTVCGAGLECVSGLCIDGVCCQETCTGLCQACNLEGKAGTCTFYAVDTDPSNECGNCQVCSGAGACKFVAAGVDPLSDCDASAQNTCGQDGTCDGNGACALWGAETLCAAASCTGSSLTLADHCDGGGQCADGGSIGCCPYLCNTLGNACLEACSLTTECCTGFYCGANKCVSKKAAGQICGKPEECLSGLCETGKCK